MKFRQSAFPYLLLMASILIGIPVADNLAVQEKNATIIHKVNKEVPVIADCYQVHP